MGAIPELRREVKPTPGGFGRKAIVGAIALRPILSNSNAFHPQNGEAVEEGRRCGPARPHGGGTAGDERHGCASQKHMLADSPGG